jgi:hypothetical protein
MKKLLFAFLVTAPLAYGQSTAPAIPDTAKDAKDAASTSSAAATDKSALTNQAASDAGRAKAILGERNCLRETGSMIVRHDKCVNATGQSFNQADIDRTGTYDAATALERMSPQVQIRPGH